MCWSVLQCVALRYSVLHIFAVCCSMVQCVAVCCSVLQYVRCSVLQHRVALRCSVLQCYCSVHISWCCACSNGDFALPGPQSCTAHEHAGAIDWNHYDYLDSRWDLVVPLICNTATHCSILQYTATHCNTLQHTATHCNTLQHTTCRLNPLRVSRFQMCDLVVALKCNCLGCCTQLQLWCFHSTTTGRRCDS